ncbi:putative LRR receptor-like serine/threonine-protein kinase [Camellia lanceoleosa]|uniref:LRR receptor-like serine/threonine-protein kinase n=1 Tax=Camellia lanceoleosa TaxID=1840588 RepID=A0ACC0HQB1_9ERIC|nr:putative LRR receptor-like serine/threonine-protein kinase [Camellia lanceoleosa]
MFLTNNSLTGEVPDWIPKSKNKIVISYNNFTESASSDQFSCQSSSVNLVPSVPPTIDNSAYWCLHKGLPCPTKPKYHDLFINCGGDQTSFERHEYEEDSNGVMTVKTFDISSYTSIVPSNPSFDVSTMSVESLGGMTRIFATLTLPSKMVTTLNQSWQVGPSVFDGFPTKRDFQPANLNSEGTRDVLKGHSNGVTRGNTGGGSRIGGNRDGGFAGKTRVHCCFWWWHRQEIQGPNLLTSQMMELMQ